jgi:hypothetical protein
MCYQDRQQKSANRVVNEAAVVHPVTLAEAVVRISLGSRRTLQGLIALGTGGKAYLLNRTILKQRSLS